MTNLIWCHKSSNLLGGFALFLPFVVVLNCFIFI